jgi:hypothetical protein
LLVSPLQLEYYWPYTIIAGADSDAWFTYPIAIIEKLAVFAHTVSESENVLIDSFPGLITKAFRAGEISVKNLTIVEQRAKGQIFYSVFLGQFLIKSPFKDRNAAFFHKTNLFS